MYNRTILLCCAFLFVALLAVVSCILVSRSAYEQGHTSGYQSGVTDGYKGGYKDGQAQGYQSGYVQGGVHGYNQGVLDGQTQYIQQNCLNYPFALLNPNDYWACKKPGGSL